MRTSRQVKASFNDNDDNDDYDDNDDNDDYNHNDDGDDNGNDDDKQIKCLKRRKGGFRV